MNCMAQYGDDFGICPVCGFAEGTLPDDSRCITPGDVLSDRYIVGMPLKIDSWLITYIGWDALTEKKVKITEFFPTRFSVRDVGRAVLTAVRKEPLYKYSSALL